MRILFDETEGAVKLTVHVHRHSGKPIGIRNLSYKRNGMLNAKNFKHFTLDKLLPKMYIMHIAINLTESQSY